MFNCDTARISKPVGKMFLIVGMNKNTLKERTKDPSVGVWTDGNGNTIDFDYVDEKIVASGHDFKSLMKDAKYFKQLLRMSWTDYLKKFFNIT